MPWSWVRSPPAPLGNTAPITQLVELRPFKPTVQVRALVGALGVEKMTNKASMIAYIRNNLEGKKVIDQESPNKIWLGGKDYDYALTTSLKGVVACLVTELDLNDHILIVDDRTVASGRLKIMLWVLNNAPLSFHEAVKLMLIYEKENLE